jgi:hypothetical protein
MDGLGCKPPSLFHRLRPGRPNNKGPPRTGMYATIVPLCISGHIPNRVSVECIATCIGGGPAAG